MFTWRCETFQNWTSSTRWLSGTKAPRPLSLWIFGVIARPSCMESLSCTSRKPRLWRKWPNTKPARKTPARRAMCAIFSCLSAMQRVILSHSGHPFCDRQTCSTRPSLRAPTILTRHAPCPAPHASHHFAPSQTHRVLPPPHAAR